MSGLKKKELERFRYWQGQKLRSSDFRTILDDEAQRRWWHNRALHNAWGIYRGLGATAIPSVQQPRAISVEPGLAYDCFGRELLLQTRFQVSVPANLPDDSSTTQKNVLCLVVRYKDAPDCCCAGNSQETCWPKSGTDSSDTIEFAWQRKNSGSLPDGVVLGELQYTGLETRFITTFVQVKSQPYARPLLATGATIPGNTPWQPWGPFNSLSNSFVGFFSLWGVQTNIDTSSAGFTAVPCYFAWLEGPLWNPSAVQFLPAFFPSLANESSSGFTFRLLLPFSREDVDNIGGGTKLPARSITSFNEFLAYAQRQKLYVAWVGCQMPPQVPLGVFRQGLSNVSLLQKVLMQSSLR